MQLNFLQAESTIKTLKEVLIHARTEQRVMIFYEAAVETAKRLELEDPVLPRQQKA